eukprot:8910939-Pyramimonas_sp.AAC.1
MPLVFFTFSRVLSLLTGVYTPDRYFPLFHAGVHYIEYLEAGNYFCIEKDEYSLRAGIEYELPLHNLLDKSPNLLLDGSFALHKFKRETQFDV